MPRAHTGRRRLGALAVAVAALAGASFPGPAIAASAPPDPGSARPQDSGTATPAGGGKPAIGEGWSPGRAGPQEREGVVPGKVLVTLDGETTVTGHSIAAMSTLAARSPSTTSEALNEKLHSLGASSLRPLFPNLSSATTQDLTSAARTSLGDDASDLSRTYVVEIAEKDSAAAARRLSGTAGVAQAEPDRFVNTMNIGAHPLSGPAGKTGGAAASPPSPLTGAAASPPSPLTGAAASPPSSLTGAPSAGPAPTESGTTPAALPANYGLTSSTQAYLNAGGVNAVGAFAMLQGTYGRQPGAGVTITNVSIGDLTDQAMADAGDEYVRHYGPTTVLKDGKRYLDLPSMPLIPTYVAGPGGTLDPAGSTKEQDPVLGEVLLDFGVMAPLPHDRQRDGRAGNGYTDLLGIAPGADYRLVVPQEPTIAQIAGALLAAARQSPRPDVITASLGFGTDSVGFPGRYLEDDPVVRSIVAGIVQKEGIVVSISSNDGTRLYTPTAVGPDGGSTPTDVTVKPSAATSIDDDAMSTIPSRVVDSGAIAAGGTTLDDILAVSPESDQADPAGGVFAETRISGSGTFSSGFGSRVDLSAPSDGIVVFQHTPGGGAEDVTPVISGGTSASAPEIAAAAAVVIQAGRLAGHRLSPADVRALLKKTGREVATPPQIDRPLQVGSQIDVTAATSAALKKHDTGTYDIVRLSVAHRVIRGGLGGSFLEETAQDRIDLTDVASGGNGEGLVGPVTFGADVVGIPEGAKPDYVLKVGKKEFHSATPAVRVTPTQLLAAAGLPVVSTSDRTVGITFEVRDGHKVRATAGRTLTIGPSDGTYVEAKAPIVPPVAKAGSSVSVRYDLTGVSDVTNPQLVVSTVGRWNPVLAPIFTAAHSFPLTATSGTVTVPADAFASGGGLYGIGIAPKGVTGNPNLITYGEFAPIRIEGGTASERPDAPTLAVAGGDVGHEAEVTRAAPAFDVRYDVGSVKGATSTLLEISAPAPTIFNSLNTFTNANGTAPDDDGVSTPSTVRLALQRDSGTAHLDALRLGLSTSSSYNVRILATDGHGRVLGQASPSSMLSVDDGLAPGGGTVLSFAAAGDASFVALRTAGGGTEVRHYSTTTGTYGAVLTSDPDPASDYGIFGTVPATHRVLLGHAQQDGGLQVETWDTADGSLVGRSTVSADTYSVVAGRVDAKRNRAALLMHATADRADAVLPVDLATGRTGTPIPADPEGAAAGAYSLMDLDSSSGGVYLAPLGSAFICLGGATQARVDLDAGTVTAAAVMPKCVAGMASDQAGNEYTLSATAISTKITPTATLTSMNGQTLERGEDLPVRKGVPQALAVDGVHHLAVVSFSTPEGTPYFGSQQGVITDNNATGQVAVVDLQTGTTVKTLNGFLFSAFGDRLHGRSDLSVQLDPATRTGWTYGPFQEQIQQFSY